MDRDQLACQWSELATVTLINYSAHTNSPVCPGSSEEGRCTYASADASGLQMGGVALKRKMPAVPGQFDRMGQPPL